MSVQPVDFLIAARGHALINTDIGRRNAISRSYYACWHIANIKIPMPDDYMPPEKVGMHKKYISYLKSLAEGSKEKLIGVELEKLHLRRTKADYHLAHTFEKDTVAIHLAASNRIFSLLGQST